MNIPEECRDCQGTVDCGLCSYNAKANGIKVLAEGDIDWSDYDSGRRTVVVQVEPQPQQKIEDWLDMRYNQSCGHEHDCCGCVFASVYYPATIKAFDDEGNRIWVVTVSYGRNV